MPSQYQEDAILARIFAMIGTTNQYCVEVGARDGVRGSNTHALRAQGWSSLLLDAHPQAPIVRKAHLTRENIAPTFAALGVPLAFDLLSIDVDGNDLHLWKALNGYRPRVVVIEYNSAFGPEQSVTIPYRPDHHWDRTTYYGASAAALVALGRERGYTLVDYTPRTNLVFVEDAALAASPSLTAVDLPPKDPWSYPVSRQPWEPYPPPATPPPPAVTRRVRPKATRLTRTFSSVPLLFPAGTVACLATGPSLTQSDVDLLRGKVDGVIAINDAYRYAPWADVLYGCDAKWWNWHKGVECFRGLKFALQPTKYADVRLLRQTGVDGLELDPTAVRTGKNSGYQAINVAVHLGATRILLLGYDMKGDHFFGRHPDSSKPPFTVCRPKFKTLIAPLAKAGVTVWNCTRSTALDAFPLVPLEEALR